MKTAKWVMGVLAATIVLSACSRPDAGPPPMEERVDVPDFTLRDTNGNAVTLSSFRGKSPVLLTFWATWCGYCREEIPRLVKLKEKYGDRLAVLGIDIEEPADKVAAMAAKLKVNYPQLLDMDGEVAGAYGVVGVPTLVLIDREGKGVYAQNSLSKKLLSAIERLVAGESRESTL